jgi:hypothetical protein
MPTVSAFTCMQLYYILAWRGGGSSMCVCMPLDKLGLMEWSSLEQWRMGMVGFILRKNNHNAYMSYNYSLRSMYRVTLHYIVCRSAMVYGNSFQVWDGVFNRSYEQIQLIYIPKLRANCILHISICGPSCMLLRSMLYVCADHCHYRYAFSKNID